MYGARSLDLDTSDNLDSPPLIAEMRSTVNLFRFAFMYRAIGC